MRANAIVGTPNILFLGAGASKPYGKLLMGEFIRSFRKKIEPFPEHLGSEHPRGIRTNSSPLFDAICEKQEDPRVSDSGIGSFEFEGLPGEGIVRPKSSRVWPVQPTT